MTEMTQIGDAPSATRGHGPWPTFVVCAVVSYISTLDMSIVNVAFAEIARTFPDSSRGTISWVVTAYSILFGSLLVVAGGSADRFGRKRTMTWGTTIFLVGSFVCAVSPGLGVLIVGRAIQGVGGALLVPSSLGLLLGAFPAERRSQVIAWTGAVGALGVASGPTLGALCVSAFGWRSAFWINVPICVGVLIASRSLRESDRQVGVRPDVAASVIVTLGVGSMVWAISRAESLGWGDTSVLGLLAVSAVFLAVLWWRSTTHPTPLLPPALFRERSFSAANIASFVFGAGFSANILNNVLFLRTIWGFGVVKAGLFSALAPIVVAATSVVTGRVMRRSGFRSLLVAAPLAYALVVLVQSRLLHVEPAPWSRWLPLMFLLGITIGATFPALSAASVQRLEQRHFALGGAINNTFRQVGAAVGVALVVTVQATADGIDGYRAGWVLVAVCGVIAALVSLAQPRSFEVAS